MTSILYVVATPIGNLADMSPRAVEVLKSCRLILAEDTRHSRKLLDAFQIETPMISYHRFNERRRAHEMIRQMQTQHGNVALISDAGTPCLSDPGYEVVRKAHDAGITVYGVSGPSAAVTALSVSGLPVDTFVFYGFPPRKKGELQAFLKKIPGDVRTSVFYESPQRIIGLLKEVVALWPDALVSVSSELTKVHEKTTSGPIEHVLARLEDDAYVTKGEYTVVLHFPERDRTQGQTDKKTSISIEALIVDVMIKKNVSARDAGAILMAEEGFSRNDVYAAGLRLKDVFQQYEK